MKRKQINISNTIIYTLLIIWAIITLYPFLWVVINSFKSSQDILRNSLSIPIKNFTFDNYINAFTGRFNIFKAYFNSFIISGSVVVGVLIIAGVGSFALARYDFPGKKIIYGLIIAAMMFPIFSIIQPLAIMLAKLNLNNTRLGVILPQIAGNIAFAVVILTSFIQQLPLEVEESAYIDGANLFQRMFRIVLPMAKPAFATTSIFVFLWSYNDLFLQMIVIKDTEKMPISVILREISSLHGGTDFGLMSSSVTLIIIPILIVYFILQKNIIAGLTAGAIKG